MQSTSDLAAYLASAGVKRGDRVTIALPNIPQAIVALYAAESIGAIVNLVSPKLGQDSLKEAIGETKVLFLLPNLKKKVKDVSAVKIYCGLTEYGRSRFFFLLSPFLPSTYTQALGAGKCLPRPQGYGEGDGTSPAFLLHSAGTAGEPKTVVLSGEALNNLVDDVMTAVRGVTDADPEMGMLAALPLFHGFGLGIGIHLAMSRIRCLPMPRFSAKKAVSIMKRTRVSVLAGVPSMFRKLSKEERFSGDFIKNLDLIFCGGDRLGKNVKDAFESILQKNGCFTPIMEGYGMSETAGVVTINVARPNNSSVGQPLPGAEIRVRDGEILLRARSMMMGYLESDGRIVCPIEELDGKEYFPTGDMGFLQDGDLYFLDRKKRTIKIGGNNVFPGQVEQIAAKDPSVRDAVAVRIVYEDKPAIKLLVVAETDDKKGLTERLNKSIERSLSRYAVPRVVEYTDRIKKTSFGKSDYRFYEKGSDR